MSKSMGFRNSGKLDLGGRNMEYILAGVLLVIIVVGVVSVVGQIWGGDGSSPKRADNYVKCVKCNEEWKVEPEDTAKYFSREMEREIGGAPVGADCDKCGRKKCVFLMLMCPECKKYYLSKRITDPDAFKKGGSREICPYCGQDLVEWYKKRHRRR